MPSITSRRFFAGLLALSGILLALLIRPLAEVLLFAAVIAAAIFPVQSWLTKKLRGHRTLSAVLVVVAFSLALLVPLFLAGASVLKETVEAITSVTRAVKEQGFEGLVAKLPEVVRGRLLDFIHPTPERQEHINQQLGALAGKGVHWVGSLLSSTGAILVSAGLMLIALVVFLIDGPALVKWIEDVSPLERGETSEILREFKSVTYSVMVANVGTSAVQSLVAFVGYLIARMPQPAVATVITFIASFIPGIGGSATVVAAAGVLFLRGEKGHALFLLIWAIAVVGVVDNVVKPMFVKRGLAVNGAVIFFSLLAGMAAFGPSGLLLGPLIVVFFLTLVRIYGRDYAPSPSIGPKPGPMGRAPSSPEPAETPGPCSS